MKLNLQVLGIRKPSQLPLEVLSVPTQQVLLLALVLLKILTRSLMVNRILVEISKLTRLKRGNVLIALELIVD